MADEQMRKEYAGLVQNLLRQAEEEKKAKEAQNPQPPQEEDPAEIEALTNLIRDRIQQGR